MNPGKAIAQGSHATNDFEMRVAEFENSSDDHPRSQARIAPMMVEEWREDRTFGRCLTVAAKPWQIDEIMEILADEDATFFGDTVIDPTYPLIDGETLHLIPLLTCGWVFVWNQKDNGPNDLIKSKLRKLNLYK